MKQMTDPWAKIDINEQHRKQRERGCADNYFDHDGDDVHTFGTDCTDYTPSHSTDGFCRIIVRFKQPSTMYERMVSTLVRSPVHVDVVFDQPGLCNKNFSYSVFTNEKFSRTLLDNNGKTDKKFDNLAMSVSTDDFTRCVQYMESMVDKVRYNYSDAMLLMPTMPRTGSFTDTMIPDVRDEAHSSTLKSVYCSQVCHSPYYHIMRHRLAALYVFSCPS